MGEQATFTDRIRAHGRVLDMDFGLAVLHTLVGVTTGAKPRNAPLSFAFSRRPQHSLSRGKVHI